MLFDCQIEKNSPEHIRGIDRPYNNGVFQVQW